MQRRIKEKRERLKVLRIEKKNLIAELRAKRQAKRMIEQEMAQLWSDIRYIQGRDREW